MQDAIIAQKEGLPNPTTLISALFLVNILSSSLPLSLFLPFTLTQQERALLPSSQITTIPTHVTSQNIVLDGRKNVCFALIKLDDEYRFLTFRPTHATVCISPRPHTPPKSYSSPPPPPPPSASSYPSPTSPDPSSYDNVARPRPTTPAATAYYCAYTLYS